jgi:hypothetical protein
MPENEATANTTAEDPTPAPMDRAELLAMADGPGDESIEIRNVDLVELCRSAPGRRLFANAAKAYANRPPERRQKIARSTLWILLGLRGIR